MREGIERLHELQRVFLELRRVEQERAGLPARREALEGRRREAEERLQRVQHRLEERKKERRKSEQELKTLEDRRRQYKDQLMLVKTNKEYQAFQEEIGNVSRHISDLETKVLVGMEEGDADEKELAAAAKDRQKMLEEFEGEGARLADREGKIEGEIQFLHEEREKLEASVPADLLERFRRVAAVREGLGMVEGRDSLCTACQTPIRPQAWHELRHGETLVTCDACGRILYHRGEGPLAR